jgi:hypothetical protein
MQGLPPSRYYATQLNQLMLQLAKYRLLHLNKIELLRHQNNSRKMQGLPRY